MDRYQCAASGLDKRRSTSPRPSLDSSVRIDQTSGMRYPKSDHSNGKTFFNPTHPESNGLLDVVKMLATSNRRKWPREVLNEPKLRLSETLDDSQVAVTFVNHASVLIQTPTLSLLTDPVYSERVSPVQWVGPKRVRKPGVGFDELPRIDGVLVSHNHYDHLDIETLVRLKEKFDPQFVISLGDKDFLAKHGITKVTELDWWQDMKIGDTTVTFTPTQHFSGRGLFDRDHSLWGGYFITSPGAKIYFGGDAAYSTHFNDIRLRLGAPDIALLPIGAYDPRWFMHVVHMNPEEAVRAHLDLQSKTSIGIHFGTFQLTEEAIDQPVKDLELAKTKHHIPAQDFITLREGQTEII